MLHRPLWTWRTAVARVYIDRYEHEQRSVWDDFLNAFTQFSQCFCPILSMFLPNYSPTFTRNIHYFNITMPLVLRYIDPYFLKPYSYNNTFLTTLFKTTLFKMIHTGFTQSDILKTYRLGTAANISRLKKALIEKDLVSLTAPKHLDLSDPILALWLKRRVWREWWVQIILLYL